MQITFTTSEIKEDIIGQEIIKRIAAQFMSVTSNDELKIDSKIDELKKTNKELNDTINNLLNEKEILINKINELKKANEGLVNLNKELINKKEEELKKDNENVSNNNMEEITTETKVNEDTKKDIETELLQFDEIKDKINNGEKQPLLNKKFNDFAKQFKDKYNKKATKKAVSLFIRDDLEQHYPNAYRLVLNKRGYNFNKIKISKNIYDAVEDIYNTIVNTINKHIQLNDSTSFKDKILIELNDLYHNNIKFNELTINIDDVKKVELETNDDELQKQFDYYYEIYNNNKLYQYLNPKIKERINVNEDIDNKVLIGTIYKEFVNDNIRKKIVEFMQEEKLNNIVNLNKDLFDEFQDIIIKNDISITSISEDNNLDDTTDKNIKDISNEDDTNLDSNNSEDNINTNNEDGEDILEVVDEKYKKLYNYLEENSFDMEKMIELNLITRDYEMPDDRKKEYDKLISDDNPTYQKILNLEKKYEAGVTKNSKLENVISKYFNSNLTRDEKLAIFKIFKYFHDVQFDNWDHQRIMDIIEFLDKEKEEIIIDEDF